MSHYTVVAFYKFIELSDIEVLKLTLHKFCKEKKILGTIILAKEGINGTIAGTAESIKAILELLRTNPNFLDLECKYSYSDLMPFDKIKIIIKKEIVTFGVPGITPSQKTGMQVAPNNWNQLISDSDVLVIDTRNNFEVELGTFKGAINPKTSKFGDFPTYVKTNLDPKKHKKIAMFCTGGIRCEKASSYLLEQGFENVYQLQGGILKYLEKIKSEDSLWEGKCFIFDKRIALE